MTRLFIPALLVASFVSLRPAVTYAKSPADGLLGLSSLRQNSMHSEERLADKAIRNLENKEAEAMLMKLGVSKAEAGQRLAGLSDREIRDVLDGKTQLKAGGDILYVVLMVLLIIFVAQRI